MFVIWGNTIDKKAIRGEFTLIRIEFSEEISSSDVLDSTQIGVRGFI